MTGQLPISPALAEAGAGEENLAELLSRDPEGYGEKELDRVIEALREQRARWEAASSEGSGRGKGAAKPAPKPVSLSSLGLGLGLKK